MAQTRLSSEKRIDHNTFKIKIGTVNKVNPQVIYVEGRTFICPLYEKEDYSSDISIIRHDFVRKISNTLKDNSLFDKKFIIDFQVASSGISIKKKSFLSFQFLLKQKNGHIIPKLSEIKEKTNDMITEIVDVLENSIIDHDFIISKSKS